MLIYFIQYVINPHQEDQEVDLEKHHPLSLAEDVC